MHVLATLGVLSLLAAPPEDAESPKEVIKLFNGKDYTGLTRWLKGTGHEDPKKVFRVTDGMLHFTGEVNGYVATEKAYKNYRLVTEFKWGEKIYGSPKYVRNSGILLHGTGPHGGRRGVWMASIECQLAQGCEGDFICIGSKDIPVTLTADIEVGPDKKPRWKKGGKPTKYYRQFWWSKHQPFFKELIDTRGKDDVASPLGEWTKVEVIARGSRITIKINDETVNECYDASPSEGKILLQSEGYEIFFRKFELHPLKS